MNKSRRKKWVLWVFGVKAALALLIIIVIGSVNYIRAQAWFNLIADINDVEADLKYDRNINAFDDDGLTGLMQNVRFGNLPRVRLMLKYGANVNLKARDVPAKAMDNKGATALHFACVGDNDSEEDIINALLAYGADPNIRDSNGQTPMHYILEITDFGIRLRVTKKFIYRGADVNAQDYMGNTMLHLAATENDDQWIAIMRADPMIGPLLNISIKNNLGLTPASLALSNGLGDIGGKIIRQQPSGSITERIWYPFGTVKTDQFYPSEDTGPIKQ